MGTNVVEKGIRTPAKTRTKLKGLYPENLSEPTKAPKWKMLEEVVTQKSQN